MSDKIIDLHQASLNELLKHLGNLVEAIQRSNDHAARLSREMSELRNEVGGVRIEVIGLRGEMRNGFDGIHSDMLLMENRLLTAEHEARKTALDRRADPTE